jgi:hypothetical protein
MLITAKMGIFNGSALYHLRLNDVAKAPINKPVVI